jgi:hypothetical protein
MTGTDLDSALHFEDVKCTSDARLAALIAAGHGNVAVDFPIPSIGRTNDPSDIASDYLDAIYFSEKIGACCAAMDAQPVHLKHSRLALRFKMLVRDAPSFIAELRRLAVGLDPEEIRQPGISDEIADLEEHIWTRKLRLPDLGDNYAANFLAGTYYWENKPAFHRIHPTWRWGFWRSFAADQLRVELYVSNDVDNVWIVLGDRSIVERVLTEYGGLTSRGARLHEAMSVRFDRYPHVLAAADGVLLVPSAQLEKAITCWRRRLVPDVTDKYDRLHLDEQPKNTFRIGSPEWQRSIQDSIQSLMMRRQGSWEYRYRFRWAMTESGDVAVCGNDDVSFIAFVDRAKSELVRELTVGIETAVDFLRSAAGMNHTISLDWSLLTPGSFEDLCYDILLRSGRFDEARFRKHGKTKSRDGGRDIEAWTLARFNEPGTKWIFQCKFLTADKALSGSRVTVADVVDQHAAEGFGVMTNQVIDSTLYDKLDAIAANRDLRVDTWDGRRIERFVHSRTDLKEKHLRPRRRRASPSSRQRR